MKSPISKTQPVLAKGRNRLLGSSALAAMVVASALVILPDHTFAQQAWDGPHAGNNAIDGGAGKWDFTSANWSQNGGTSNTTYNAGLNATFGGTGGTLNIISNTGIKNLTFDVNNYNISSDNGSALIFDNAGSTITVAPNVTILFVAQLAGTGKLTKAGTGVLDFRNSRNFSGGIDLQAGTISFDRGDSIGSGSITVTGANSVLDYLQGGFGATVNLSNAIVANQRVKLNVGNVTPATQSGIISGFAEVVKTGTGSLTFSGVNTHFQTKVEAGTLVITGGSAIADNGGVTLSGGSVFHIKQSETFKTLTANLGSSIVLDAGVNLELATINSNSNVNGIISGDGGINKTGVSQLWLSGNNSFAGGVTFQAGKIVAVHNNALGTGNLTVTGVAPKRLTLRLVNLATNIDLQSDLALQGFSADTYSGIMSGTGGINVDSPNASVSITLTEANTFTGASSISKGVLKLNNAGGNALADTLAISVGAQGTLELTTSETIGSIAGVAGAKVKLNGGTLTTGNAFNTGFAGAISGTGGLIKQGSGGFELSGANTYTGTTTINAGALILKGGSAIADTGVVNVNGGMLDVDAAETIGVVNVAGGIVDTAGGVLTTGKMTISNGILQGGTFNIGRFFQTGGAVAASATINADYFVEAIGGVIPSNGASGISATAAAAGNLVVRTSASGNINNTGGRGIDVSAGSGDISINTAGNIQGKTQALVARTVSGNINLTLDGAVTGITLDGLAGLSTSGDVSIAGAGEISGKFRAISASTDTGSIIISGTGATSVILGPTHPSVNLGAISASINSSAVGNRDILINRSGLITKTSSGAAKGIYALNLSTGSGKITINSSGGTGSNYGGVVIAGNGSTSVGIYAERKNGTGKIDIDSGAITVSGTSGFGIEALGYSASSVEIANHGAINGGHIGIGGFTYGSGNVTIATAAEIGTTTAPTSYGILARADGSGDVSITADHAVKSAGDGIHANNQLNGGSGDISITGMGAVSGGTYGIFAETTTGAINISGIGTTTSSGNTSKTINAKMKGTAATSNGITINRSGAINNTGGGNGTRGILAQRFAAGSGKILITTQDVNVNNTNNTNAVGVHVHQVNAASTGQVRIDTTRGVINVAGKSNTNTAVIGINVATQGSGGLDIRSGRINIVGGANPTGGYYGGVGILSSSDSTGSATSIVTSGSINRARYGIRAMSQTNNGNIDVTTNGSIDATDKGIDVSNGFAFDGGLLNSSLTGAIHVTTNASIGNGVSGNPQYGIVTRSGNGTTEIDVNGQIDAGLTGVYVQVEGTGSVDINTSNGFVQGGSEGIKIQKLGAGQLDIVTGGIAGTVNNGIDATAGTGIKNITTNGAVSGGKYGIIAENSAASGKLTILANAKVTGGSLHGISVKTGSGDIALSGSGNIQGQSQGVVAVAVSGNVNINMAGTVKGLNSDGLAALTTSGNIVVQGNGNVIGGYRGIRAHTQTGSITISGAGATSVINGAAGSLTNLGAITASINSNAVGNKDILINRSGLITKTGTGAAKGIYALNLSTGSGKITIDSSGGTGSNYGGVVIAGNGSTSVGIYAERKNGTGKIDIDSGAITVAGTLGSGIEALGYNDSAVEISNHGAINGGHTGIGGFTFGTGNVSVITAAEIGTTTAPTAYGILARANGSGDVLISVNHAVSSAGDGINAQAIGAGTISITGTGNISGGTAAGNDGIDASSTSGNITVNVNGAISGDPGIILASSAGGNLTVGGAGNVTGTAAEGIKATSNGGNGTINVDRDGNVSGATDGIFAETKSGGTGTGNLTIIAHTGSTVSGASGRGVFANTDFGAVAVNVNGTVNGKTHGVEFKSLTGDVTLNIASAGTLTGVTNAAFGETTGKVTFSNAGTINGLVNVANSNDATSTFTNSGTWNAFGGNSVFSGGFINSGIFNQQNNSTADKFTTGSVLFTASSVWKIDINKAEKSDQIIANGTVTLGGVLDINANGSEADYKVDKNFKYTIISNDGSDAVTGNFSNIVTNYAFLKPEIDVTGGDGNDVDLALVTKDPLPDFKPFASTASSTGAANAMDSFDYSSSSGTTLKNALLGLTNQQARAVLQSISGNDHEASSGLGYVSAGAFHGVSMGRAGASRSGSSSHANTSAALGYVSKKASHPGLGAFEGASTYNSSYSAIWLKAFGARSEVDRGVNAFDISTSSGGVAFGAEFGNDTDWLLGASIGYSKSYFSTPTAGSSSKSDNIHAGLYGAWGASSATQSGWGVLSSVDYTKHDYKTRRALTIGALNQIASADYAGHTISGEVKVRYGVDAGRSEEGQDFVWAPIAGLNFSRSHNNGFTETGAGALNITSNSIDANRFGSLLGVELSSQWMLAERVVTASFFAGWRHEFGDTKQTNTFALQGSPTLFLASSPEEARDGLALETSVNIATGQNSNLSFTMHGDKSSTSLSYGADVTFKLRF